jgi:aldehyde:ferredoxin oxidoreductase
MSGGYTGKYGIVDLTKGTTELVRPEEAFYRKYLSGYGLGVAVITERQKPGVDPLSPESYLGFCSGLLTGTGAFFSGRWMAVGKSPLTGGWGDANAGGYFSRELKRTGFDALFFTGSAKGPVWVLVEDGSVQIRDGTSLWGRDTVETEDRIKEELGDKRVQVASIGISGEKRSLISGIVTDGGRIAARSGLGAVMGSKNLKAVALRGRQKISVAEPDRMKAVNKRFLKEYKKSKILDRITVSIMNFLGQVIGRTGLQVPAQTSLVREVYKKYGTSGLTVYSAMTGDMPIKNWEGVGYLDYPADRAAKTSDENVIRHQRRRYACQSCPLGCGGILDIHKGRYAETTGHKPEYETLAAFGGLLLHDDLDVIIEINEMCNRAGIDTISTGGAIAFAIECFEKGVIDEETTGGLALGWGKSREILKLTEMIILREGLGDLLADGVKRGLGKNREGFGAVCRPRGGAGASHARSAA